MAAYPQVNGTYCSEDADLINDTLRGTWGFDGIVMSDWTGDHSTVQTAKAGANLEMPLDLFLGATLKSAVQAGSVSLATVDLMVVQTLTSMFQ